MLARRLLRLPQLHRTQLQFLTRSVTSSAPDSSVVATTTPTTTPAPSIPQSPNSPSTWSTNQQPRSAATSGPRFEQAVTELQPNPLSAMELIANQPVTTVIHGRKAVCDGGGGPLGHPKIFINLDQPGPQTCGYCGLRFEQAPHHHDHQ